MLKRLKAIAEADDRPLSQVIRRSVKFWLERLPPSKKARRKRVFPFFDGGEVLVDVEEMRESIYDRTL